MSHADTLSPDRFATGAQVVNVGLAIHSGFMEASSGEGFVGGNHGDRRLSTNWTIETGDQTLGVAKEGPTFDAAANLRLSALSRLTTLTVGGETDWRYAERLRSYHAMSSKSYTERHPGQLDRRLLDARVGERGIRVGAILGIAVEADPAEFDAYLAEVAPDVQAETNWHTLYYGTDSMYGGFIITAHTRSLREHGVASTVASLMLEQAYPGRFKFEMACSDSGQGGPALVKASYYRGTEDDPYTLHRPGYYREPDAELSESRAQVIVPESVISTDDLSGAHLFGLQVVDYARAYIAGKAAHDARQPQSIPPGGIAGNGYARGYGY
jgi:hypothetical protein